eukprot:scaffold71725_cov84-Phaeocystis_antarctica.AAC.11
MLREQQRFIIAAFRGEAPRRPGRCPSPPAARRAHASMHWRLWQRSAFARRSAVAPPILSTAPPCTSCRAASARTWPAARAPHPCCRAPPLQPAAARLWSPP